MYKIFPSYQYFSHHTKELANLERKYFQQLFTFDMNTAIPEKLKFIIVSFVTLKKQINYQNTNLMLNFRMDIKVSSPTAFNANDASNRRNSFMFTIQSTEGEVILERRVGSSQKRRCRLPTYPEIFCRESSQSEAMSCRHGRRRHAANAIGNVSCIHHKKMLTFKWEKTLSIQSSCPGTPGTNTTKKIQLYLAPIVG